jgi:galactokinase/mevalonate kinase-like predicted kinase
LRGGGKLVIHGGGESRRLPAYAPVGKPLVPIPVLRWSRGQQLDQTLLDLQVPAYRRVLACAPAPAVALVASGDVLVRFGCELGPLPEVDVVGLGMWLTPEKAKDFGVFVAPRQRPNQLAFFLQKPAPSRLRELAAEYLYLVDTGMWLLSARAVEVILARSGWDARREEFAGGRPASYELYDEFGLGLGTSPSRTDPMVGDLTCAVVPLPRPEFYHFGTSRQMIESVAALQNLELDETKLGLTGAKRHPDQYLQNSRFGFPLRLEENRTLWVENSHVPASWQLAREHVLTGVPANTWDLRLEPGVCLDCVPVGKDGLCVRSYHIDDVFRGRLGDEETRYVGRRAADWFAARGMEREGAGWDPACDIQDAPLFPVLPAGEIDPRFLEWLFAAQPAKAEPQRAQWLGSRRLSARQMPLEVNLARLSGQRDRNRNACLQPMLENCRYSVFLKLDLETTARSYAAAGVELPAPAVVADTGPEPMQPVHAAMFRSAVKRHRGNSGWEREESEAFARLRELIVRDARLSPVSPVCAVLEDQIVWGRSPVRLDLAGGWTDTPPYCLEHGGRVVNVAVDLNGQPPVQVFAKSSARPELLLRSIDLGTEERVRTYEELDAFAQPGSDFAVAKAAFALAGFLPRFHAGGGCRRLQDQLLEFGGGVEVSMLAAVPKGSGLGTSSILAATLLATIGNLCGLNWDQNVLFTRTLALEQMLTTGGGWQDQAGGLYRGIKLIETAAGLGQVPTLRWLPDHLFDTGYANRRILLYYTGLTRLAKSILHEIVRGMFLNSPKHLDIVDEIGQNAERAFSALQRSDYGALAEAIGTSWTLNQRLDPGTNPPEVQSIMDRVADYLAATKLLGAGGGGYLLMLAKDDAAGQRIREVLAAEPPNRRARFVEFSLSHSGLQLTRS